MTEVNIKKFENLTIDEERGLYGIRNAIVNKCVFDGPKDGESALKECQDIKVNDCDFNLRYPFWHARNVEVTNSRMTDTCRAALWYDDNVKISDSVLGGIKALRECQNTTLNNCDINSTEFGWFCRNININNCKLVTEYPFLQSTDMKIDGLNMKGKYSFQYTRNLELKNCILDSKDAFWHGNNITVTDSIVKGEYLAWYSENVKFVRCKIIGTQPLCYCKNLILEDCEMIDTDLSFENSNVNATINGDIISVKNPCGGKIIADSIGEIIIDEFCYKDANCEIIQRKNVITENNYNTNINNSLPISMALNNILIPMAMKNRSIYVNN